MAMEAKVLWSRGRCAEWAGTGNGLNCRGSSPGPGDVRGLLWSDMLWNEIGEGDLEALSPQC